jgi:thiol-disulfide isomerase/thioredoxin
MRFAISVLTLSVIASAADPRLRIGPTQPKPDTAINITYNPKGGSIENAKAFTLLYGFSAWDSLRTPLKPQDGGYVAELKAPADAVYFWCKVEGATADDVDTNRGGVWDTYLYDSKGLPLPDARRRRAELYMLSQQPLEKNLTRLILLEEELRAHPNNAIAWGQWWGLRFEDSGGALAVRDEIVREINNLRDSKHDQPWAYRAAAIGFNHMGMNPRSVEVVRGFVQRFPQDASLDDTVLFAFGNFGTAADMESLEQASRRWAAKPEYWNSLLSTYARTRSEPSKLLRAGKQWLATVAAGKDEGGRGRSRIAEVWLAGGVDPAAAEAVAREAVKISELSPAPSALAVSPIATRLARGFFRDIHRSTLGWALYQQGKYQDALRELEQAVAVRDKEKVNSRALFFRLGQTLEKLERNPAAMDAYFKELTFGAYEKPTREAIAVLYRKMHGNTNSMETAIRERVNELLTVKAAESGPWIDDVREKVTKFELRGPAGPPVNLETFRGKVVLIEFWATWCPSCLRSMEHTWKLKQQFKDNLIVLAVSQDGEETRPKAIEYLKAKGYDFILLFDEIGRRNLEVPFIPARVLLDRSGTVRVREYSWSPAQESVFESRLHSLLE